MFLNLLFLQTTNSNFTHVLFFSVVCSIFMRIKSKHKIVFKFSTKKSTAKNGKQYLNSDNFVETCQKPLKLYVHLNGCAFFPDS